jgi:hypothetical protein
MQSTGKKRADKKDSHQAFPLKRKDRSEKIAIMGEADLIKGDRLRSRRSWLRSPRRGQNGNRLWTVGFLAGG